jgi:hypothetical protein
MAMVCLKRCTVTRLCFNEGHRLEAVTRCLSNKYCTPCYLVMCRWEVLQGSYFLTILGFLVLLAYVVLSRVFWFRVPFVGVSGATVLYFAGLVWAFARP